MKVYNLFGRLLFSLIINRLSLLTLYSSLLGIRYGFPGFYITRYSEINLIHTERE